MDLSRVSKFISLLLRHKPEEGNLTLDEHGWCDVDDLIRVLNERYHNIDMSVLEEIVKTDEKGRYSFNEDKTLIRANQGHSINVDVELKETKPPKILYHGTGEKSVANIKREGLKPMSRLYVHLSKDIDTANKVGSRHGVAHILVIDTERMFNDGYKFYLSENNVWLTKEVPTLYISDCE